MISSNPHASLDAAAESAAPTSGGPRPADGDRTSDYPFLFRLLHWVLGGSLVVLFASGPSLHAVARPGWSLLGGHLPRWFLQGRVQLVHLSAAVVFTASLLAAVWIYARQKVRRRATHLVLLGGGVVMIATAQVLLNPVGPPPLYWAARLLHGLTAVGLLTAFVWHVVDGLGRSRHLLVRAFHPWANPQWRQLVYFLPAPLVAACLVLDGLPTERGSHELVARRIAPGGRDVRQLPWDDAAPVEIELADGIGFDRGRTRVTLRALHDGRELFVLAEWRDPVEDRRYMPWKKTPGGWQWQATDEHDESVYYEDKFSLVFPTQPDWKFRRFGCAAYCHAGGGRAYGYKGSDYTVDVWHWKSTRTAPVGQVDDKYWSAVDFSAEDVGRHGDPKEGGGYEKNLVEDRSRPAYLPDDPAAARDGVIPREHAVAYSPEAADKIAPGSLVPGIVLSKFQGDRGDIRCRSEYDRGRWRVYMRRALDTGSAFDVRFVPGGERMFACAAFDHSSKRHAYALGVWRLRLEP